MHLFVIWSDAQSFVPDARWVEAAPMRIQASADEIRDLAVNLGRFQLSLRGFVVAIRPAHMHWQSLVRSVGMWQPSNEIKN